MRRYLSSKLTIVALVLAVVTLITGVTWAATSPASDSAPVSQAGTSVVEIQAIPLVVAVNGSLQVAGAGFNPGATVLFKIIIDELSDPPEPAVLLQGGSANAAGAFLADATANLRGSLPDVLVPGVYTIQALQVIAPGQSEIVASAPLVVVDPKDLAEFRGSR